MQFDLIIFLKGNVVKTLSREINSYIIFYH